YGMVVGSDDDFRVTVAERADPAALQLGIFDAAGGRGYDITPFFFNVPQAGVWPMRLVYDQGQGGANLEWFLVDSAGKFALLNDTSNPVGLKAFRARAAVTPPPQITAATISGGSISINWTGGGAVEFSSALGPGATWTSTGNSSGSFSETVAPTGNKFYRIKR